MALATDYLTTEPSPDAVAALPGDTLLEFGSPWCGHCRGAQPALAQAMSAHEGLRHLKVEDGRGQALGRAYRVKLWPTFVLLRDGREVAREVRPQGRAALTELLASAA